MARVKHDRTILGLVLLLLAGCGTQSVRLSDSDAVRVHSLLVVAMEAPPLQVVPDRLEQRMPAYRHFDNMALPWDGDKALFLNPGGVLTAGKVGLGDSVEIIDDAGPAANRRWAPALELAQEAARRLQANDYQVTAETPLARLPLADHDDKTEPAAWRAAVERWYAGNAAAGEYRRGTAEQVDAVLEIGIGDLKIFHGQTSFRLFMKLVDFESGRILARSSCKVWSFEGSAQTLLNKDAAKFKALIRETGTSLLADAFRDIGLRGASVAGAVVRMAQAVPGSKD